MYMINSQPVTGVEAAAIQQHLNDYPRCNGTQIVDDNDRTLMWMKRQLRCLDCGVKFKVRGSG